MNPRVSRSSALASKATGFPIAKVAAKLAVGYTLDELKNEITKITPASFEPTIDYVVTKIPRFNFEKFPGADEILTSQMKSVGEVMAIGSSFQESFQKAIRGLEIGKSGLEEFDAKPTKTEIRSKLISPSPERIFYIAEAFRRGYEVEEIYEASGIDPWFLSELQELISYENLIMKKGFLTNESDFLGAKKRGFSDQRISQLLNMSVKK